MKTAVSYQSVVKWFAKAQVAAASQGKADSATLWKDGLEHLQVMCAERDAAMRALEMAYDVMRGEAMSKKQLSEALKASQKVLKARESEAA